MNKYETTPTLNNTSIARSLTSVNAAGKTRLSIRALRWITIILIQLVFVLSFRIDIQILEGTLVGSRFLGFHMIDPYVFLQYVAANQSLPVNLIIGTATILILYIILGRAFCSWVCPYSIISELGEFFNSKLAARKIVRHKNLPKYTHFIIWIFFLALCVVTGHLVFEFVSAMAIMNRFIIYGIWGAMVIVAAVFLAELLYSRRVWCRHICPIGFTYGLLNKVSIIKVGYKGGCDNCGACRTVCYAPKLLNVLQSEAAADNVKAITGIDCTMCGRCVDVCHKDALGYTNRLKNII